MAYDTIPNLILPVVWVVCCVLVGLEGLKELEKTIGGKISLFIYYYY